MTGSTKVTLKWIDDMEKVSLQRRAFDAGRTAVIGDVLHGRLVLFGSRCELTFPDGLPLGMNTEELLALVDAHNTYVLPEFERR